MEVILSSGAPLLVFRGQPSVVASVSLAQEGTLQVTEKETLLQNHPPAICLACKICWDHGGTEHAGVATKCLISLVVHATGGSPYSYTAWVARNLKLDSTET